jgi:hypothetical protein
MNSEKNLLQCHLVRAGTRGRQAWQLPRGNREGAVATNNNIFNISEFLTLRNVFL